MLIKCPECELQLSDKALSCPHCGYPMKSEVKRPRKSTKRKRLPNGFGQISEIKNQNLRKPFRAMITVGKTELGRPICKPLKPESYFETYNAAYEALLEYNKSPYDIVEYMTMDDLFQKWIDTVSDKSTSGLWRSSWKYCTEIYQIPVKEVRVRHLKSCIDNAKLIKGERVKHASAYIKEYIKSVFNLMLDYAVEYELADRNYARNFNIKELHKEQEETRKEHIPYSDEELSKLWSALKTSNFVDMVLIQCYSGWRPQELCDLKIENINLENGTMTGGMKTNSGKNRVVPIHSRILPLVERRYNEAEFYNSEYLFNDGIRVNVPRFTYQLKKIITDLKLNPDHRPHDGRVTFVTLAKKYKMDEYAIKYIVGHSISDITEKIYTQRDENWLKTEIEKIK